MKSASARAGAPWCRPPLPNLPADRASHRQEKDLPMRIHTATPGCAISFDPREEMRNGERRTENEELTAPGRCFPFSVLRSPFSVPHLVPLVLAVLSLSFLPRAAG